jgi:hypothetical protein
MIRMALHLFGYDLRAFVRNRQSQFFALALPVLFLVIFVRRRGLLGHRFQPSRHQFPSIGSRNEDCICPL